MGTDVAREVDDEELASKHGVPNARTGDSDGRRRHIPASGRKVDFTAVRKTVEDVAGVTLAAWRRLSAVDELALAESAARTDFDELEFLVTRSLGELTGIKNIISFAKRMA